MDDQEYEHYEQSEEDFVVEMVDLDGLEEFEELDRFDDSIEGEGETWRETPRDAGQAVISQSSRLPSQTPPVVRVSLRSRLTRRQRMFRLAYTAGVVVVALFVLVLASSPAQNLVTGLFRSVTPEHSPTPLTGAKGNTFFLQTSPSWGKAYLDAHPLSQLVANDIAPVVLANGHHTFTWVAAPFLPQRCIISIPSSRLDTCLATHITSGPGVTISKIAFSESLASLPEPSLSALLAAAQTALDGETSSEIVHPGERYIDVTKPGKVVAATQSLRATLRFELTTTLGGQPPCLFIGPLCGFQVSDCRELCTIPQEMQPALPGWNVVAPVRAVWDYTTLDGRPVAQSQPDALVGDFGSEALVSMQIERVGSNGTNGTGWRVLVGGTGQPFSDDLSCSIAEDGLGSFLDIGRVMTPHGSLSISFASQPSLAVGCLAVVILEPNSTTPTTGSQLVAYCFYRFGLWLAVNQTAHRFWPTMLQANAYERSLARTIMSGA